MSTIELIGLAAVTLQIPLAVIATLAAFSQRKKRRQAAPPAATAGPASVEGATPQIAPPDETEAPHADEQPPAGAELAAEAAVAPADIAVEEIPLKARPVSEPAPPPVSSHAPATAAAVQPETVVVLSRDGTAPAAAPPGPKPEPQARREPARIGLGIRKTRENFLARIRAAITGSAKIEEIYEGLEEALIGADVGVETSLKIVEAVRARLKNDARPDVIRAALKDEIDRLLSAVERPWADSGDRPLVVMMVGVNGAGKTTTVAKLAARLKGEGGGVIVAAADTFRAAAIEQLEVWCNRVGAEIIKQNQGSDPAAVAFDAVRAGVARKARAVIIDTAGRLQTKVNLMEELKKIARVVARELPGAPHETWLVLDATTGQNALSQAKVFGETVAITGVILTKLDGTAKGGVIVGIAERLKLPVRFVGLGESIDDLRPFDSREFVEALFAEEASSSGTYAA